MKLWLLTNDAVGGYDTYDSAVVAAPDELAAQMTHPNHGNAWDGSLEKYPCWCRSKDVIVKYIGEAAPLTEAGVVCASFNAG